MTLPTQFFTLFPYYHIQEIGPPGECVGWKRGEGENLRAEIMLGCWRLFVFRSRFLSYAKPPRKSQILYQTKSWNHVDTNPVQSLLRHRKNYLHFPTPLSLHFSRFHVCSVSVLSHVIQPACPQQRHCALSLVKPREFSSEADSATSDLDVSYQGNRIKTALTIRTVVWFLCGTESKDIMESIGGFPFVRIGGPYWCIWEINFVVSQIFPVESVNV